VKLRKVAWSIFITELLAITLVSISSLAQGSLPGIQPFSTSAGGPYDFVDLANTGVLLNIPVRNKTGKIPFSYSLVGNFGYSIFTSGSSSAWVSYYSLTGDPMMADFGSTIGGTKTSVSCGSSSNNKWTSIYLIDPTGASHPFPSSYQSGPGGCSTAYSQTTSDGTGYTLVIPASTTSYTSLASSNYSLYDKAGNKSSQSSGTITVTDPDSASMNSVPSGGTTTYTDTLNVQVLTAAFTGGAGGDTYGYTDGSGNPQTITVSYAWFPHVWTNFRCSSVADNQTGSYYLPTSISTPSGSFGITYEQTPGEPTGYITERIAKITLPSGGYVSYTYTGGSNNTGINCSSGVVPTLTRTVNDNNGNTSTWTYINSNVSGTPGYYTVIETDPMNNQFIHVFSGEYQAELAAYQGGCPTSISSACNGGGTLLSNTITCYNGNFSSCPTPSSVPTLPITRTTTYTAYNGSTTASVVDSFYDATYGNLTDVYTYDSLTTPPSGAPSGSYVLHRALLYGTWNGTSCSSISGTHINNALCSEWDGVGSTPYRGTEVTRDSYGHPSSVKNWVTGSTYLTTTPAYSGGVLTSVTEPNGAVTQYSSFTCNGIFPQTITYPLTGVGSGSLGWDCNGGVITSQTDPNGGVTSMSYSDPLWRPTVLTPPSIGSTTTTTYNTGTTLPWSVSASSVIDGSQNYSGESVLDGLGRVVLTENTSDPAGTDYVATTYDKMGRVSSVSNPYRAGDTIYTTNYTYDALGRMLTRTNPDTSVANWTYSKRAAKFVDENYKTKVYQYDGEGDLLSVCEVTSVNQMSGGTPSACGQDIAATGFGTFYTYDPLGRLTQVNQPGVTNRTYSYDGLSRVTQEVTPEAGTINYTYDASGQQGDLATITKPATNGGTGTITATYTYDKMHRVTGISYSDGVTPYKGFVYDSSSIWGLTLSNPKGRLSEQYVGSPGVATSGAVYSYDVLGRVVDTDQCTPLLTCGSAYWHLNYVYNNASDITTLNNYADGSGIAYVYTYDAANHLTKVTSSLVNSTHPNPLWSTTSSNYKASGLLGGATLGNGISRSLRYDTSNRLNAITDGSIYSFGLNYNSDSTISSANDSVNGNWSYTYDDFNRLSAASTTTQSFAYSYDRQGNRWGTLSTCAPGSTTTCQYTFSNNQITNAGVTYDLAGNVTYDGFHSYTYDFDGRILKVDGGTTTYSYNALGQRVAKVVSGSEDDFVLDQAGRPITGRISSPTHPWYLSEVYAGNMHLATYANGTTAFPHRNWVGTVMASTGPTGSTIKTCSGYLPFGDGSSCTATDGSSLGFTSLWWDSEDALNNTPNRNYESVGGRWTTPDPAGLAAVDITDPQTWNRYTYVTNNPLSYVDPLGLNRAFPGQCQGGQGICPDEGAGANPADLGGGGIWGSQVFAVDVLPWNPDLPIQTLYYSVPILLEGPQNGNEPDTGGTSGGSLGTDPAKTARQSTAASCTANGADATLYACATGCAWGSTAYMGMGDVACPLFGNKAGNGLGCLLLNHENADQLNNQCMNSCMQSWSERTGCQIIR